MGRLVDIFDDKLITPRDFAVHRPQSINDLGSGSSDIGQAVISASTDALRTSYRVDYSDFSNFVFFNSALDYFNVSGERIINDFPRTGSTVDHFNFLSSSDDYQRWIFENSWPSTIGSCTLPAYADDPNQQINAVSSSFTVEFLLSLYNPTTGTIAQKRTSGSSGFEIFTSASAGTGTLNFRVYSGTTFVNVSHTFPGNVSTDQNAKAYVACVVDRSSNTSKIIIGPDKLTLMNNRQLSGFISRYPTATLTMATASISTVSVIDSSGTLLVLNSGVMGSSRIPFSYFSYWSTARSESDIAQSYAGDIYSQDNLELLYRFDEAVSASSGYTIRDYSGNSINAISVGGPPSLRVFSGNDIIDGLTGPILTMSQTPNPVTSFNQGGNLSGSLELYIQNVQSTASLFDKMNTNSITRMVPEAYLQLEDEVGTDVLRNFLYIIARQFDQIKVAIDQFTYWNKSNYTGFDDTPDSLLRDAANFYGWDFVGNFLNHDAIKYFFGKNVVPGADLDVKLYEIKNQFWRRTLNELMYIYKTKGTKESVDALIRVYGLDNKIVKLKEYGTKPFGKIETNRINSHRSVPAFISRGGVTEYLYSNSGMSSVDSYTLSMHLRFPQATGTVTGTIATIGNNELRYWTTSGSSTGTIQFRNITTSENFVSGSASFVDGRWWSLFLTMPATGSPQWNAQIDMRQIDGDAIVSSSLFSGSGRSVLSGTTPVLKIGHVSSSGGSLYVNETKFYANYYLGEIERSAQALDFQSYGTNDIENLSGSLILHWRLDDYFTLPSGPASGTSVIFDYSGYGMSGSFTGTTGLTSSYRPFQRFLFDYNFVAPIEYGWNEDKIRVYDGSEIDANDHFNETNAVALEFNLVDTLNEDISKIFATMDNWNNVIGIPANKYRETYHDLQKYRSYYFNKLGGRINFREFADVLEFFDRSFVKMVQRLLPARAVFYGEEFVIESHMLERPKVQWVYRRYNPELVPEGIITMVDHSGSDVSVTVSGRIYG